jgi:hypothetical protein
MVRRGSLPNLRIVRPWAAERPHPPRRPRVFHAEPLRYDDPLAPMDNVTLTAHAGFRTLEASMTLLRRAIDIVGGSVLAVRGSR